MSAEPRSYICTYCGRSWPVYSLAESCCEEYKEDDDNALR